MRWGGIGLFILRGRLANRELELRVKYPAPAAEEGFMALWRSGVCSHSDGGDTVKLARSKQGQISDSKRFQTGRRFESMGG